MPRSKLQRERARRARRCGGTLYRKSGRPQQAYVEHCRCDRCGRIDYEANEGDKCRLKPMELT